MISELLPEPETPVTAHEHAERELDVDILQVVLAWRPDDCRCLPLPGRRVIGTAIRARPSGTGR